MSAEEGKSEIPRIKANPSLSETVRKFVQAVQRSVAERQGVMEQHDNLLLLEMNNIAVTNDDRSLREFTAQNQDQLKLIVLNELKKPTADIDAVKSMLELLGSNVVMTELYAQLGKKYVLGGHSETTTDCVQILRGSKHFRGLVDNNPVRYFSEGSDMVLHENLGKVANVVDRKNFSDLSRYKPTKDKIYIFAMVKPPLYLNGKPNVTHLQIATDLQADPAKLAVIHASSDHGKVVVEQDVGAYLEKSHFERVYVIEVDLKNPYVGDPLEREPYFEVQGYHNDLYRRPPIYDLPLILDDFVLISDDKKKVEIYPEEKNALSLISDNRALSYLTVLTGIREGKLGNKQNIMEEMAYRTYSNPTSHSLGLHQVTSVVTPLFNKWLRTIDVNIAKGLGIEKLWRERRNGRDIFWSELTPLLTTYDISDGKYEKAEISTICAYLLIKHLYEDQLMSAYAKYGETFYGLEEQPEALIALASAYRSSMPVLIRGAQQYRIAEMAKELGVIDSNFNFTEKCKESDEYRQYIDSVAAENVKLDVSPTYRVGTEGRGAGYGVKTREEMVKNSNYGCKFMVDGYAGVQTSFVAYMCYKKLYPNGKIVVGDFKKAYDGNLNNLLSGKIPDLMKQEYQKRFGKVPKLLMAEDELRTNSSLKFANEGLWAIAHYRKMAEENWDELNGEVGSKGEKNPIIREELRRRSYLTNEISKIPAEQVQRFYNLLQKMTGNRYYKKFPGLVLAACFVRGFFLKEGKNHRDGKWVVEVQNFINEIFLKNSQELKAKMPVNYIPHSKALVELCALSSIMTVDEVVEMMTTDKIPSPAQKRNIKKLNDFPKSFYAQKMRYMPGNPGPLLRYAEMREMANVGEEVPEDSLYNFGIYPDLDAKEKREAFPLRVFDLVRVEALKRGFSLNFALVVTAMATLECGWGRKDNRFGEPTLFTAANNIFSIKYDTKQYSKIDFEGQSVGGGFFGSANDEPYYIYHTVEYFDANDHSKSTEHYEAFRRYKNSADCVKDFFDLMERKYPLTVAAGKMNTASQDSDSAVQKEIMENILKEKYATDPEYSGKVLILAGNVEKILRKYGQII